MNASVIATVVLEPWKDDDSGAEFLRHFGIPYDEFMMLLSVFEESNPDKLHKYEKIRAANEEAAILWAVHEGRSHGILTEMD